MPCYANLRGCVFQTHVRVKVFIKRGSGNDREMLRQGSANAQQYSDMEKSLDDLLSYQLANVVPVLGESGREVVINAGSYGRILKVLVNGALCAAKEIHYNIVAGPNNVYVRQFIRECELISQMRHPNVVQFLGIHQPERPNNYAGQPPLPWLVMEFLPSDLHSFLERLVEIPLTVRVAILLDIVQGLSYLHNNPSLEEIIHRDLSARNILLTASLTAKLADFGVSKQRAYDATMTKDTGNPLYMPPENKAGSVARYNSKMDIFSFGVIMLFTLVKKFPSNLETETYTHPTRGLLARSEIERRQKYFDEVESSTDQTVRTLVTLCKSCLENLPERRLRADDLVHRIRELNTGDDELMAMDKMQLMVRVRELETRRQSLSRQASRQSMGTSEDVVTLQAEVEDLREQLDSRSVELQSVQGNLTQLRQQHSGAESELRRLHEQVGQVQGLQAELTESRAEKERLRTQLDYKEQELSRKQHALDREKEITDNYQRIIDMGQSDEATDRDELQRAQMGLLQAQTERDELRRIHDNLSEQLQEKEVEISQLEEAVKKREDDYKRALQKAIEYKDQLDSRPPQAPPTSGPYELIWPVLPPSGLKTTLSLSSPTKQDPSPHGLHSAHGVRYHNQVLFGGAVQAADSNHKRAILCYDLDLHKWSEFSWHPCRHMHFAMAVVNGRLLLVGGYIDARNEYSDLVFEYNMATTGWKECCRLPNKRAKAAAFGYRNWLIVAGGTTTNAQLLDQVNAIELGTGTNWKVLKPIPEPIQDLQIASYVYSHHSDPKRDVAVIYLTACRQGLTPRQPTMAVSVPDLIHRGSQWVKLPDPPVRSPGVITMRGHLLAVGGQEAKRSTLSNKVYMYHHGTREWLSVAEITNPRQKCTCVGLSDTKFMVLGGKDKRTEYSTTVEVFSLPTPNSPR